MSRFIRAVALTVSLSMGTVALAQPGQLTLITTEQIAQEGALAARSAAGEASRERLAAELDRPELQAKLQEWGVSPEQARARVDALTDEEAQRLVARIDQAPAGAGDVLGAIVFIFVLLLVTDILGLTKVFPFTRSVR
ncbi:MAG: PA2779 family protein [Caldimonas sp.]|uniref:PA2779 family protein n=1 Tax=Caldimonas sp. TaxID=2838790 RepID=UPI00391975EF